MVARGVGSHPRPIDPRLSHIGGEDRPNPPDRQPGPLPVRPLGVEEGIGRLLLSTKSKVKIHRIGQVLHQNDREVLRPSTFPLQIEDPDLAASGVIPDVRQVHLTLAQPDPDRQGDQEVVAEASDILHLLDRSEELFTLLMGERIPPIPP